MDFLYSLYDALVSINIPSDKARAVVDAMERDMGTTLATKSDLLLLEQKLDSRFASLEKDLGSSRKETEGSIALLRKDMELLRTSMTVRLGSMLVVTVGLLFAALKLT